MRKLLFVLACVGLLVMPAFAGDSKESTVNVTYSDGQSDGGWVVANPGGSSDYFNARFDNLSGRTLWGITIGSTDFNSGLSYPSAGLFDANFAVDASGNTANLGASVALTGAVAGPGGGGAATWVYASFGGTVVANPGPQHIVVQLVPGDAGQLGCGLDSNVPGVSFAGWTNDGFATPSNGLTFGDWCFSANVEVGVEAGFEFKAHINATISGDFNTANTSATSYFGVSFYADSTGALWLMYLSFFGTPVQRATPVLPAFPDGAGHSYFRAGTSWPIGFGNFTLNFMAIAGYPGVVGSVGLSNEITVFIGPDPSWGIKDDGSIEGGWVVGFPTGSSDYFSQWLNIGPVPYINNVLNIEVSILDFGTAAPNYPDSGPYEANLGLDPSGWTPQLGIIYDSAPFTFPPLVFDTVAPYLVRNFGAPVPYALFPTDDVHAVVQLPPGDSGLAGIGADSLGPGPWGSTWTQDGYATNSNRFDGTAGFGIRLGWN